MLTAGCVGQRSGDEVRPGAGVEHGELQVVGAVGRTTVVVQPPLVGEGRALRAGVVKGGQKRQPNEYGVEFVFHNQLWIRSAV